MLCADGIDNETVLVHVNSQLNSNTDGQIDDRVPSRWATSKSIHEATNKWMRCSMCQMGGMSNKSERHPDRITRWMTCSKTPSNESGTQYTDKRLPYLRNSQATVSGKAIGRATVLAVSWVTTFPAIPRDDQNVGSENTHSIERRLAKHLAVPDVRHSRHYNSSRCDYGI